jgi:hypothetical protein
MSLNTTAIRRQALEPRSYRITGGIAVLFVVFAGLLFSASPVLGATPWWGLTSGSWPTNLHSGGAKDEVQELTVSATSGDFFFGEPMRLEKLLPYNARAEEVQKQLQSAYPANELEVSGGPLDTATGRLIGPVTATGNLTEGFATVEEVAKEPRTGAFATGQRIEGEGIPTGTTILAVEGTNLTLSNPVQAGKSGAGVALTGLASSTVEAFTTTAGAFVVGQEILGNGVAPGTTIEAIAGPTVTLSLPATETRTSAVLSSAAAPYVITFPSQRAPLIQAHSFNFLNIPWECKTLEEFGFGSCGAEPSRMLEQLKGGTKPELEVTEQAQGRPDGKIVVTAENLGDAPADGSVTPVVLEDVVPSNLEVVSVEAIAGRQEAKDGSDGPVVCSVASGRKAQCVFEGTFERKSNPGVVFPKVVPSYEQIEMRIAVRVAGASSAEANAVTVSGGGARLATLSQPLSMGSGNSFGVADYQLTAEEEGGAPSTQAGVHPFQLTTITTLATSEAAPEARLQQPAAMTKDLTFQLPPGLIGNPTPLSRCTALQFTTEEQGVKEPHNECEAKTAIGVATITFDTPGVGLTTTTVPVFNLEPRRGEPARFGFEIIKVPTYIDISVRAGSDYGVTATVPNITEIAGFISSKVTFWGVPGDPSHDNSRGWRCAVEEMTGCSADISKPPPFLSMPTSCTGPMPSTVQADSWAEPHPPHPFGPPLLAAYQMGGLDGCNRLQFSPEIKVTPDGTQASKPTGLNVDVHVPQTAALNPEGLAESNVKDITVALPEGIAVNPAGGDGLQACSEGLVGFTGFGEPEHFATFTGTLPEPLQPGVNFCAEASKIGTLTIKSPLLPAGQFLKGFVYLATQNENPFGSLIALYLIAKDPISGVVFKSVGETRLTPSGQVIGVFDHNPQLAFEDAELHFFGEERAPLASPAHCGPYTTNASFTPWSGTPTVKSSSTFQITSGPNGSSCPGPTLPFSPSLAGGTTNINAGSFSPLTTTIGREDGQQNMQSVQLHLPPGLSGLLSGVKLCPEAQANEGTCGPESLIGETTVSAGVGSDPVSVMGGRVYITEKYAGAPFGLSIVNPVKAGPFDLEHDTSNPNQNPPCDCIVVRAKVEVDPTTAALTVTTDPLGLHAIPHLIDGIPVQIKKVNVLVNRPNFTFNPTNCSPLSLTGSIASDEGATSPVSERFQAASCAVLKFAPKFSVSTSGKTSKANGASLSVKLVYPKAPFGSQANIAKVKVDLPKQLPSRLTTLQKACTAAQFKSNPASCPAASLVGHAKAITPLIPVPLEGPAYFVSNGGEAFPNLIMVLQGYGVTIDLVGDTFINRAGITSSTFKTVPDAPIGSFELTLPQGRFSALAANGNLCASKKLAMPTEFVAQNGLKIHESTKIRVTGCAKKAKLTRTQKLAKALKGCRKTKVRRKRVACERLALKRYAPIKKAKKRT